MEIEFNNDYIDPKKLTKDQLIQVIQKREEEIKSLKKKYDLSDFTKDGLEKFADVLICTIFASPSLTMQLINRLKILLK